MIEIGIKDLQMNFGGDDILKGVSFEIQGKERIGLIGNNGTGKTTILRLISGEEKPDSGLITFRKDLTLGYLKQVSNEWQNNTVDEVLKMVFADLDQMKTRLYSIESEMALSESTDISKLMREYGDLQLLFEQRGGYDFDVRINMICSGLKISSEKRKRPFSSLSGGEKTRIMLARILLQKPDVILLDEPTNHLDIDSVEWLETFLKEYEGTVLIVSHDRYFLDNVVTRIVELEQGKIIEFSGNYSYYHKEKQRRFDAEYDEYKDVQKKIKAMKAAAERYRTWGRINTDNASHMARAKRLEEKIEELQKIKKPGKQGKMGLEFSQKNRSGKDVLSATDLTFRYSDQEIFNRAEFNVRFRERVAILGANGSGKTTLFKLLTGSLSNFSGELRTGSRLKTGYLEQEIVFEDEGQSIIQLYRENYPMTEGEARNELARFLFYGTDVFKLINTLSGGEKVRLKLAFLNKEDYNLLLLDEPTNHLDIYSKERMEEALKNYPGTIVFISHDRYFINKFAERILEIRDRRFKEYLGNYDYYREKKNNEIERTYIPKNSNDLSEKKRKSDRQILQNQKNKIISQLEETIEKLEETVAILEASSEEHSTNYEQLAKIFNKKDAVRKELEDKYHKWTELNDKS